MNAKKCSLMHPHFIFLCTIVALIGATGRESFATTPPGTPERARGGLRSTPSTPDRPRPPKILTESPDRSRNNTPAVIEEVPPLARTQSEGVNPAPPERSPVSAVSARTPSSSPVSSGVADVKLSLKEKNALKNFPPVLLADGRLISEATAWVVEDLSGVAKSAARMLAGMGFKEVVIDTDGDLIHNPEFFAQHRPSVVLMDFNLPRAGMDNPNNGENLTEKIKQMPAGDKILVLGHSAEDYNNSRMIEKGAAAGFIKGTANREKILAKIEEHRTLLDKNKSEVGREAESALSSLVLSTTGTSENDNLPVCLPPASSFSPIGIHIIQESSDHRDAGADDLVEQITKISLELQKQ
jgi:CheY-like chemotaxis protein